MTGKAKQDSYFEIILSCFIAGLFAGFMIWGIIPSTRVNPAFQPAYNARLVQVTASYRLDTVELSSIAQRNQARDTTVSVIVIDNKKLREITVPNLGCAPVASSGEPITLYRADNDKFPGAPDVFSASCLQDAVKNWAKSDAHASFWHGVPSFYKNQDWNLTIIMMLVTGTGTALVAFIVSKLYRRISKHRADRKYREFQEKYRSKDIPLNQ